MSAFLFALILELLDTIARAELWTTNIGDMKRFQHENYSGQGTCSAGK